MKVNDPVPPMPGRLIELLERTMLQTDDDERSTFITMPLVPYLTALRNELQGRCGGGKYLAGGRTET